MSLVFSALLLAASAHAQDLEARQAGLRSLEETLSKQKPVNWVQTPPSSETSAKSTRITASINDVKVDAEACTLSLKDRRVYPDEGFESVQAWQFKISSIDRLRVESLVGFVERLRSEGGKPSWATKIVPAVFVLEIEALPNHKFDVHRWSKNRANEVSELDLQQSLAFIVFAKEAGAREAEKAIPSAKAFCATKTAAYRAGRWRPWELPLAAVRE